MFCCVGFCGEAGDYAGRDCEFDGVALHNSGQSWCKHFQFYMFSVCFVGLELNVVLGIGESYELLFGMLFCNTVKCLISINECITHSDLSPTNEHCHSFCYYVYRLMK